LRKLLFAFGLLFLSNSHSVEKQAEVCFGCHGKSGTSQTSLTPSLGSQPSFFVVAQLFLFRDGRRGKAPTPMDALAKNLSDADLQSLAAAFEKLPPPKPPAGAPDAARFERGKALLQKSNCGVCHNPDFSGRQQMARLANQREDYLLKAMRDYKSGQRIGYGSATMPEELSPFSDVDLGDIAHYLAFYRKRK
jgi:cytochrome c553